VQKVMKNLMPFTEKAFDTNDYFIIVSILVLYAIMYFLPKRLPVSTTILLMLFGTTIPMVLDNAIGSHAIDLYDIMDGPAYSVMDYFVYFLYAPFAYFFIYFYVCFRVKGFGNAFYIMLFSLIGIAFEWICVQAGVFQYKNTYNTYYSFPIYLMAQTGLILFYKSISTNNENNKM
jgi:hypothetical protein